MAKITEYRNLTTRKENSISISYGGISLWYGKSGDENFRSLKKVQDNYSKLRKLYEKQILCRDLTFEDVDDSALEAFLFVAEHATEDWSCSPYSLSFYNSRNIGWNSKPDKSLRVSNHWNFVSNGEVHCKTTEENFQDCWALGQYSAETGKYSILKVF